MGGRKGVGRKVQENSETGREMTRFLLSSSQQGLRCPQGPPWLPFTKPEGGDRGEVACLGLGCYGKQEVPVISQEGSTVGREPAKAGRPPRWGGGVWPGAQNPRLPRILWVCHRPGLPPSFPNTALSLPHL